MITKDTGMGVPEALHNPPILAFLQRHVRERPEHIAVIDGGTGESVSYRDLFDRVERLAQGLHARGVKSDDRVGIIAVNSLPYVELLLALAALGAIAVPQNLRLHPKEIAANLADARVAAVAADSFTAELASAAASGLETSLRMSLAGNLPGWIPISQLRDAEHAGDTDFSVSGETTCTLLYTSGTTGRAKGCMLPHRSWVGYALNMAAAMRMSSDDVYLALLPYFHVAGLGTLLSQLILGGTVVTQAAADPGRMFELIQQHKVTIVFVVPGISTAFVDHPNAAAYDTGSLRLVISGAGLERPDLVDLVADRFQADYAAIYGQTESGTKISWATSEQLRNDPYTYGSVMPLLDYRIVDENDNDVLDGTPGELVIRGMTVMQGYWNQPEVTAETLRGGWHHTGDVFVHSGNGLVRMVDRTKYLIKTGGENVYPQEVENVLRRHPDVVDVAVAGIPDPDWGEAVKAFVVSRPDREVTKDSLDAWVRQEVAGYKAPKFIEFVSEIPRNASGKILKDDLSGRATDDTQRVKGRSV